MANHVATTLSHRMRCPTPVEPGAFGADAVGRTRSDHAPAAAKQDADHGDTRHDTTSHAEAQTIPDVEDATLGDAARDTVATAAEDDFRPDPNAPPDPAVIRQIEEEIPRLRRFARAMVRDATLADDLVQECLERALSRLHLWRPGTNLRAWLFTILRNLHINGVRRRQPVVDIDAEAQAAIGAAPGSQFVRMELRDLRRALALLPNEQREVVLLIGLEGISYNEAADILAISIGTVKSRLSRGRRALRLLMEGHSPSDDADA
ncbi:sigma-70 family RNA polymerase sigma factor [Azospirillum sp. TSO35-2]|uniref:RNA polymerase sigma factor n=1 Tax=Azospirillum sp. TSO35-2 TaxID=716796 RepID=UPI00200041DA|nr:sigma-70 family RNA polymerase sigma factor [Azospirillum sp. TSO35-2]